jgi:energy-converting hydrogenase A subunit R
MKSPLIVCFDMEGPLTPVDFAQELFLKQVDSGNRLYNILSRYDDILALELWRPGYEAGDTLALIVPFLVATGLDTPAIVDYAEEVCKSTSGASETLTACLDRFETVAVITTAYAPFAHTVLRRLEHRDVTLFATDIPDSLSTVVPASAHLWILSESQALVEEFGEADLLDEETSGRLVKRLDRFFLDDLVDRGVSYPLDVLKPRGGSRKVDALKSLCQTTHASGRDVAYVGDSITDVAIFEFVSAAGGLSVAFNGNAYAVGVADVAIASDTLTAIVPLLDGWREGGRQGASAVLEAVVSAGPNVIDGAWLRDSSPERRAAVALRHAEIRREVRGKAADLG